MVTGSHIPDDRNGIKFYRPDGEIDQRDEAGISAIASELDEGYIDVTAAHAPDGAAEVSARFLTRNKTLLASNALSGLTVGVYQHSTVARDLFIEVLQHYGAKIVALGRSATFVPVDTEAVSQNTIELLRHWAEKHQLDAIVSADGDGDRPLVADESGHPLRGDLLGLITARFLQADAVVTPVTSNSAIDVAGGFYVVRTRVGSPYVIAGMKEALLANYQCVMGFEANGGALLASPVALASGILAPLPTRDSFLPTLATLSLLTERKQPLSVMAASFGLPFAASNRLEDTPVDVSRALMSRLRESRLELERFLSPVGPIIAVNEVDGLRVTIRDGRIVHFRPSGNAPEMRCYVEAKTQDEADALLHLGLDLLRQWTTKNP
jgi:phosphomannomutase